MTIFISIASYCDKLLEQTVRDALAKATTPSNLFFGIVEQNFVEHRLNYDDIKAQVRYVGIDVQDARGACWARAIAMSLYSGETWYLQVDSHTVFEQGWDTILMQAASVCARTSPKFVISNYPYAFKMVDGVPVLDKPTGQVLFNFVNDNCEFRNEDTILTFTAIGRDSNTPLNGYHLAAGFIFTLGKFVYEVPYDPHLYFEGEEQTLSVRAYTHGWDIYHTTHVPVYHLYNTGEVETSHRELHWAEDMDKKRNQRWWDLDNKSKERMTDLLHRGKSLGVYGLGNSRSLVEYANFSGIDYRNKVLAPYAKHKGVNVNGS